MPTADPRRCGATSPASRSPESMWGWRGHIVALSEERDRKGFSLAFGGVGILGMNRQVVGLMLRRRGIMGCRCATIAAADRRAR